MPALHNMRMVCCFKVVNRGWVTNTISVMLVIGYVQYGCSLEILQPKVKFLISAALACTVPRTSNKHYSARNEPIDIPLIQFS